MSGAVYIWLAAIIVFLLVEAGTVALVSIWFAGGALLAMIAAALGAGVPVQLAVFVLSSGLLLALMWPLAKKRINGRHVRTNADRLIGREVLVTEQIENLKGDRRDQGQRRTLDSRQRRRLRHSRRFACPH